MRLIVLLPNIDSSPDLFRSITRLHWESAPHPRLPLRFCSLSFFPILNNWWNIPFSLASSPLRLSSITGLSFLALPDNLLPEHRLQLEAYLTPLPPSSSYPSPMKKYSIHLGISMPTLNQLIRHGREEKRRTDRTRASDQCPQKQGVRPRVPTRTPKKPNSAPRKIAKVRLSNRHDIFAHIPGEGHNSQEHSIVLIRGGRVKDSPGVKSHCIRGVKDLLGIPDRRKGRSKYGAEKPKSIWMEDASGTLFSPIFSTKLLALI